MVLLLLRKIIIIAAPFLLLLVIIILGENIYPRSMAIEELDEGGVAIVDLGGREGNLAVTPPAGGPRARVG